MDRDRRFPVWLGLLLGSLTVGPMALGLSRYQPSDQGWAAPRRPPMELAPIRFRGLPAEAIGQGSRLAQVEFGPQGRFALSPGERLVAQFEGSGPRRQGRLQLYKDSAGTAFIGYGHWITDGEQQAGHLTIAGDPVPYSQGITVAQANALLRQDLAAIRETVDGLVTVPLADHQREALASFAYNVGLDAFATSTLLQRLNAGEYAAVPAELRRFTRAGGQILPGLVARREAEIELWDGHL